jgi:hypothetical protein
MTGRAAWKAWNSCISNFSKSAVVTRRLSVCFAALGGHTLLNRRIDAQYAATATALSGWADVTLAFRNRRALTRQISG